MTCAWCGASLEDGERLRGRIRCRTCGAATTSPWPSEEELERAYGGWYRPGAGRFSFGGDELLRRSRALLARRLDRVAPPGPVLDVGAGEGVLVDALRRRGRRALGLERASDHPHLRSMAIEEVEGEWSAVVFWHSLEHLRDPGGAVRHAARLLRSGGVLAVAVPNSDSLQARFAGDRWLHLDPPLHLVHLTERSLVDGLRRRGLSVARVSHARGGQIAVGWLDALVGALPGHPSLYQAMRRPEARTRAISDATRNLTLAFGAALAPLAVAAAGAEVAARRGGTVYVEARRD